MIRFEVLGPLIVRRDGSQLLLSAQMHRRVLSVLLARANHVVSVDELIAGLWGEAAPDGARKTVQIYIHRLRQVLGEVDLIVSDTIGYRLRVEPDQLDAEAFERRVDQGRKLLREGNLRDAVDQFDQALKLWRGSAYEGANDRPPVLDAANRLDEERLRVASEQTEAELALGHHEELVPRLAGLTTRHPYNEDLRRHLMLALYRCGRQAEALDVYHHAREVLREELGLEPGTALRRMHESILRSAPELELVDPEKPAQPVIPRELPSAPYCFTGRSAQLALLNKIMLSHARAPSVPIALITGSGGMGKTALALHWAHQVAHEFPDGQLFVDLRGYSTGTRLKVIEALTAMLRSLGVPPRRIPVSVPEAAALYRSQLAGRRALIILDNARSADEVRTLMPGSPGSAVIVTSRDRLGGLVAREGARRIPVDALPPDEAVSLVSDLVDGMAHESAHLADLARACGFLPLALRVAVAHLLDHPHQTVAGMVSKLRAGQRLHTLDVLGDDAAAVRSAFDLSYSALAADPQRMLRRLGTAPCRDFTAETAAALTDVPEEQAAMLLERLADVHLVTPVSEDRFVLHDLLRDYSRELSDEVDSNEDRADALLRLQRLFLARAYGAAPLLYPNNYQVTPPPDLPEVTFGSADEALAWLDADHENVVLLLRSVAQSREFEATWILAYAIRSYFDLRRYTVPWLSSARAGLAAARATENPQGTAAMLQMLGHAYGAIGRFDLAIKRSRQAAEYSEQRSWLEGKAMALNNLGVIHGHLGQPHLAIPLIEQCKDLFIQMGHQRAASKSMTSLAVSYLHVGNLARCLELSRQSSSDMQDGSHYPAIVNGAAAEILLGRLDAAVSHLTMARAAAVSRGSRPFEAYAECYLGMALADQGLWEEARTAAARGISIAREIALQDALSMGLVVLGRYFFASSDYEAARRALSEASELPMAGYPTANALIELAWVELAASTIDAGLATVQRAMQLCANSQLRACHGRALVVLAQIRLVQGMVPEAQVHAAEALAIQLETGHRVGQAESRVMLAQSARSAETAREHLEAAQQIYAETGAVPVRLLPL